MATDILGINKNFRVRLRGDGVDVVKAVGKIGLKSLKLYNFNVVQARLDRGIAVTVSGTASNLSFKSVATSMTVYTVTSTEAVNLQAAYLNDVSIEGVVVVRTIHDVLVGRQELLVAGGAAATARSARSGRNSLHRAIVCNNLIAEAKVAVLDHECAWACISKVNRNANSAERDQNAGTVRSSQHEARATDRCGVIAGIAENVDGITTKVERAVKNDLAVSGNENGFARRGAVHVIRAASTVVTARRTGA